MSAFVLDCSIAMSWCFEDEASADAILTRLDEDACYVPAIWPLEVANVLAVGERRRRLTPADSARFLELLAALPITIDLETAHRAFAETLALARQHSLSTYDAAYLELAMRQRAALATLDIDLRAVATRCGVSVLT